MLPILYGDRFVARFEPVLDKKTRVLTVKNWWWEEDVRPSKQMQAELARCVRRFMRFLGATSLQLNNTVNERPHMKWLAEIA